MTDKNRQKGNEIGDADAGGLAKDIDARQVLSQTRSSAFDDCIFAIRGAIAFGIRGTNAPPDGHWLAEFYDIGKKLARPTPEASTLFGMSVIVDPKIAPDTFEISPAPEALGAAKWQPIETAPKNEDVLVYAAGSQYVAWFQNDETDPYREDGDPESDLNNLWCVTDNKHGPYALRGSKPSHWMYLPHDPAKDQS